ncbi:ATP-grasp domain-containing protein [Streptomyces sp. NPDC056503]|uniref:ATP-grasp domain-containing protein n=1 Tax=Streptomyces sp. NPDC056503 TaxID=3345842 RepID=UPI0036BCCC4A
MRVLIVDGYSTGSRLAQRLHAAGVECWHTTSMPEVPEYYARSFLPDSYARDLGHREPTEEFTALLRAGALDAVVPSTESGVELAERLTAALGLRGNDPALAGARRNKVLMAAALRRAGVAAPRGEFCETAEAAVAYYRAQGLGEAVVKPADSAGSDHVTLCSTAEEVREATLAILGSGNFFGNPNSGALVQERLRGTEYYINSVSSGGIHRMVETWRYTKTESDAHAPVYDHEEPVPHSSATARLLHAYVREALTALGIRDGAAHSEVMLTASGPVLIETGARLGGGVLPAVAELHFGSSHLSALTDAILGRPGTEDPAWGTGGNLRYVSLINRFAGPGSPRPWARALLSLESCTDLVAEVPVGAPTPVTADLASSPGYLYLSHSDRKQVISDYEAIRTWESEPFYTAGA